MIYPTVCLNGTARQALLDQYIECMAAISNAVETLCANGPNGRDYQLAPSGSFAGACGEHAARVAALENVRDDLELIAEHIAEVA